MRHWGTEEEYRDQSQVVCTCGHKTGWTFSRTAVWRWFKEHKHLAETGTDLYKYERDLQDARENNNNWTRSTK